MKDLIASFDKVRWHLRYEKIPSFTKLLRYKLANNEIVFIYESFLNLDRILLSIGFDYLFGGKLMENQRSTSEAILTSLEHIKISKSASNYINIENDYDLSLIKCNFLLQNNDFAISKLKSFFNDILRSNNSEIIHNCPKSTLRMIVECTLSCTLVYIAGNSHEISYFEILKWLELCSDILMDLLKYQESNIVKRVKTSTTIYPLLIKMLLLCFKHRGIVAIRNRCDKICVAETLLNSFKTINSSLVIDNDFVRECFSICLSIHLYNWFPYSNIAHDQISTQKKSVQTSLLMVNSNIEHQYFNIIISYILPILKSLSSQAYNEMKNSNSVISDIRNSYWFCIGLYVIILGNSNQFDIAATLILKYLPVFFENDCYSLLLACAFYSCNLFSYATQTCLCALEFNKMSSTIHLLFNIRINHSYSYDLTIKEASDSIDIDAKEASFYHVRAVCYLEKAIETLSFSESLEFLNQAKNNILKAISIDDNDFEFYYYASIIFGLLDDFDATLSYAIQATKRALFDSRPYHLLFLVFLSKRRYDEALKILSDSEREFPLDFSIILNRINFEQYIFGPESALPFVKNALDLWKNTFSIVDAKQQDHDSDHKSPGLECKPFDTYYNRLSFLNDSCVSSSSKASSFFENSFYHKFSSKVTISSSNDAQNATILLIILYKKLAEILFDLQNIENLKKCAEDVHTLGYACPEAFLIQSYIHTLLSEDDSVRNCLETAICIEPNHIESLRLLSYHYLQTYIKGKKTANISVPFNQDLILAEESARRLVKLSPKDFHSWQCLGKVLFEAGNIEESTYCLNRSLELENFFHFIPFKTLFRKFRPSDTMV